MPELAYFPASIGTGLALQKVCGFDEEGNKVGPPVIGDYHVLMLNLRTLYRNFFSSYSAEERNQITLTSSVQGLVRDIQVAADVMNQYSDGKISVVLYSNGYQSLTSRYPNASIKPVKTFLQQMYADFENQTIEKLYKDRELYGLTLHLGDISLPKLPSATNVLIVTHFPIDLLHGHNWETFDLLESHTGVIKKKLQWNTKLGIPKEDIERMPFNKMTLQLYGDKGNMLLPYSRKLGNALIDVARKYRWNTATTRSRIEFSLKNNGDPVLRGEILRLLHT